MKGEGVTFGVESERDYMGRLVLWRMVPEIAVLW